MAEQQQAVGLVAKGRAALVEVRRRVPVLDHALRMNEQYLRVNGRIQAGGVTYFGFLSFFPILAVAFFVVGYVSYVWPDARENLVAGIEGVLPGIVGEGEGQIRLEQVEQVAGTLGLVGLVGLTYTGLGWLSAMRGALLSVFELLHTAKPTFVMGKLRDLLTLIFVGTLLIVSVTVSSVFSTMSHRIVAWLGVDDTLGWALRILTVALGVALSTVLFYMMFKLLARPDHLPAQALWSGAFLGAVGFEGLKRLAALLMASTARQPAFQAFGISLILLVWIYYFSQVVIYSAAWAQTAVPRDEEAEGTESGGDESGEAGAPQAPSPPAVAPGGRHAAPPGVLLAVGALAGAVLARLLRGRGKG